MEDYSKNLKNLENVKEFLEKYLDIEKEYSRKLNNLRKCQQENREISEFLVDFLLEKSKNSLNCSLEISTILKKLETVISRKTSLKNSLDKFLDSTGKENEILKAKVGNSRENYIQKCDQVQVLQLKLPKIPLKKLDKAKKDLNSKIIDMNNCKNLYLIEISSVNSTLDSLKGEILPEISENLLESSKTCLTCLFKVNLEIESSFKENLKENTHALTRFSKKLHQVNIQDYIQEKEYEIKLQGNDEEFCFQDSGLWKDRDEFVIDENSRIFLWNSKEKLESRISKIIEEIKVLDSGIQGLESLRNAYTSDEKNKDEVDVVQENILESKRARLLLRLNLLYYSNQLKEIAPHVQDMPSITPHSFKSSMFTIPTACDLCSQYIWGISKPGMTCKVCSMNVHLKCEMKVDPDCSTTKERKLRPKTGSIISLPDSRFSILSNSSDVSLANVCSIPNGEKAIALYDYIPNSSSKDELDMVAGDELVVVTEDDGSGWTKVSRSGSEGLVPTSYIEIRKEVNVEASHSTSITRKEVEIAPSPLATMASILRKEVEITPSPLASTTEKTKFSGSLARVLFDYQRKEDDELTVYAGQSVWIVLEDDGSGWTQVTNGTESGHVPSSYISMTEY